jgi:thioredoxin reductase (NADPH)
MAIRETVIMGSGCSGLTAAIYTARANLRPLVMEGHEPGGQLTITSLVENFPGWPEGIGGPELIDNMRRQAQKFSAEFRPCLVTKVDLQAKPIQLHVDNDVILTRSLVIATGACARWLGLSSERALVGYGVSSCATCDGFFFSDREITVVGGGDSAMEEALYLTRFASKVTLIHRRDSFRASKIMVERAQAHPKIQFLTNTVVEEVLDVAKQEVTGLRLRDLKTGESYVFPTAAMFLGIGHVPNTEPFVGQLEMDEDGYLRTTRHVCTTIPGVFACGDVQDRRYRQAISAAGTGCMAAIEVEKYLERDER